MGLSAYIRDDLAQRIRHSDSPPEDLTLEGLANHYEVSVMPVRKAVAELVAQKVLCKGANGRLWVNPKIRKEKPTEPPEPVAPPTDWGKVLLREAIEGSLVGEPVHWKINPTAERFGIGVNVVRTVFHQLAGQGVLEHLPRRGWWVRPFRENDLDAYLDVRVTLELKALNESVERLERPVLQELLDANELDGPEGPKVDNGLHQYWVTQCGNPYIDDFFTRHGPYYQTLYSYAVIGTDHLGELVQSHRDILEALLRKDLDHATDKLAEDILCLRPILIEVIRGLRQRSR